LSDKQDDQDDDEPLSKDALKVSTTGKQKSSGVHCEFNEVKLCSKYGAFLITKPSGTFIYYST
jgi:hypothetical protein